MDTTQGILHTGNDYRVQALYDQIATRTDLGHRRRRAGHRDRHGKGISMPTTNQYGQPIGDPIPGWAPVAAPEAVRLPGRYCTLEHLDPDRHAEDLYAAYAVAPDDRDWTYLPYGPFPT